jgi:Tol biopolymer transport system component
MRLALGSVLAAVAAFVHTTAPPAGRIAFAADFTAKSYGEIYVVSTAGKVTNLSRSPAADTAPAASPDGKRVAFTSVRGGHLRVYVVGSDGRGLHPLSPSLGAIGPHDGSVSYLTWTPDSRRVAASVSIGGGGLSLYTSNPWHLVARNVSRAAAWSPDGRRLAFATMTGLVRVVDAAGRRLWTVGGEGPAAWSQHGLLAVRQSSTTIAVYGANGKERAAFPGGAFAWSPTGDVLASDRVGTLELRTNGSGKPTLRTKLLAKAQPEDDAQVQWIDASRLRVFDNGYAVYDLRTHRRTLLPASTTIYNSVFSANGVVAQIRPGQPLESLVRGTRTVATIPACHDDLPFEGVQFLGRTNALVYQSGCPVPSADIYSIAPDGTGLQQVTRTYQHETSPALSPDGSRVAYVQEPVASFCDGCAESIWASNPTVRLTAPKDTDTAPFDEDPSWSPDASQLVFAQSGANSPYKLLTVGAAGGAATPLGIAGERPVWGPKLIAFEVDGTPPKLETYDPVTHAVAVVATTKGLDPIALAWSSDGRLAFLADNGSAQRISIVGGGSFDVTKLLPFRSRVSGLAWSPDGTRFAFVANDVNGIGEVYTVGVDGRNLRQVTRNVDAVGSLSWR